MLRGRKGGVLVNALEKTRRENMKRLILLLFFALALFVSGCTGPAPEDVSGNDTGSEQNESLSESGAEENGGTETAGVSVGGTDIEVMPITIYYRDGEGWLIPVTRWIEKQEGIARAAITGLTDCPLTREEIEYYGIYPVLPQGTQILGLTIRDQVATIDFDRNILNYDSEVDERGIVASVVYTLTEFKTVKSVKILINGYPQGTLKFGTDISGSLSRDNILINCDRANLAGGNKKLDVYFFRDANERFKYIVPVSMEYEADDGVDAIEKMFGFLSRGYVKDGFYSELPAGVKFLSSDINGNIVTVNLSKELKNYGGGTLREESLLKQIVYTLRQLDGITGVKLLIEGKEDVLPEGTDISQPIKVPDEINPVLNGIFKALWD